MKQWEVIRHLIHYDFPYVTHRYWNCRLYSCKRAKACPELKGYKPGELIQTLLFSFYEC